MKWLVIAVVLFAQQPAQPPKTQPTVKADSPKSATHPEPGNPAKAKQQSQSTTAVPAQTPITSGSSVTAATPASIQKPVKQQASDEDLSIQRKLVWFTGALVVVGALQTVVMFLTWRVYARQAREMRRQRHEMRRQRHVMFRQWKAMGKQAELIEDQIAQMENAGRQTDALIEEARRQTKELADSTNIAFAHSKAAADGADAARANAEAVKQSTGLFVSKDRARVRIEMKPLAFPSEVDSAYDTVDFAISTYGPTDAFVTESLCVAYVFPWEIIENPELGNRVMFPISPLPSVIRANSEPLECFALLGMHTADNVMLTEVKAKRLAVGVRGVIKYKDVFDQERETTFRYVWQYSDTVEDYGQWVKSGRPEENRET